MNTTNEIYDIQNFGLMTLLMISAKENISLSRKNTFSISNMDEIIKAKNMSTIKERSIMLDKYMRSICVTIPRIVVKTRNMLPAYMLFLILCSQGYGCNSYVWRVTLPHKEKDDALIKSVYVMAIP